MLELNEWIQLAVKYQEQGDLVSAENEYIKILTIYPDNFETGFLMGLLNLDRGDCDKAIIFLTKAAQINPDADVYNYLALAFLTQCNYKEAVKYFQKAVELKPDYADAFYNCGIALQKQGMVEDAILSYKRAIELKPDNAAAYHNLAILLCEHGRLEMSSVNYKRAIELDNHYFLAYNNFGDLLQKQGKLDDAVNSYKHAIYIKPDYCEAYFNLGVAYQRQLNYNDAVKCFKQAVTIKPDSAEYNYYLGNAFKNQGKFEDAINSYKNALKFKPEYAEVYLNLGVSYIKQGQPDESIECCYKAIEIKPDYAEAFYNLGIAFNDKGELDEAVKSYKRALQLKPGFKDVYVNLGNSYKNKLELDEAVKCFGLAVTGREGYDPARMNRALTWLLKGDYEKGWPEYEQRLAKKEYLRREFPYTRWDGSTLNGKTILVHAEQGFGDTMQFVRFLPLVKEMGGQIIFECQKSLTNLLQYCAGVDKIVASDGNVTPSVAFDVHLQLLSLPGISGVYLDSLPVKVPYIFPDTALVSYWKEKLSSNNNLKVGLVWGGNPKQSNDNNRSSTLACFSQLGSISGVTLYSLQKGEPASQLTNPPEGMNVVDFDDEMKDFSDTAAFIDNLDLVIAVDTAVAHLAGALGKPVWVLACYCPTWHLQLWRDDCAWYPSMRVFRQSEPHDWDSVLQQVAVSLRRVVESR